MTIKSLKEKYMAEYHGAGRLMFTTATYDILSVKPGHGGPVKVLIVVEYEPGWGRDVVQVVRVSDGKELLPDGACCPCDSLDDAVEVAAEMEWEV